ncbi:MAG: RecX family transcriptional regulator [Alphaproteobacteria bacterium]|nr:RecX family transcriptional regulator [Alphaproteobacteria bacterium]
MAKPPPPVTAALLRAAAERYVARYASSTAHLERLLLAKAHRSASAHGADLAEARAWISTIVAKLHAAGAIDDRSYAEATAATLLRRGTPAAGITARLRAKGVPPADIDHALDRLRGEAADLDLTAAVAFARRKRLGPYRTAERPAKRRRDLAAMARAGFGSRTAYFVIDAASSAALEDDLETGS